MDRLTTGRRHVRAGSVTVNELLIKQASPTPCTDSSPTTRYDATPRVAAVPVAHRRPPTKGAQLAKLASLGVAGAVLCGAVTISSMVADQRRDDAAPATRPTVHITGKQALLPDQLDKTLPAAAVPTAAPVASTAPAVDENPEQVGATDRTTLGDPDRTSASAGTGAAEISPTTDLDLVREFYENLPDAPTAAFDLVSPDLLNANLSEFLASWSKVRAIDDLDLVARPDGVLATVRMRLQDGGHLRIQQLLTVAESPRRIVGVQLLSAQRN
ncbi:MAG: hypothetical protein LC635_02210 [Pseudonocardiaceae bacterium]|nr:hypothetical protein [Pseudonocardiaceae bacterium]